MPQAIFMVSQSDLEPMMMPTMGVEVLIHAFLCFLATARGGWAGKAGHYMNPCWQDKGH